ncbi:hypothetical protein shim_03230 [Shimia sp. SK013]|uniref:glutathione S-transferase family protein n=1 Tax=Shimia sp. SK013 TaxID=1389006 RepID=UPI0006B64D2A|nr:glutathione S-transferase family protein [Shimia sp. SK013]KPA23389.1 hypothetical protein shim_03230 [Shimia sp. SK013]
MSERPDLIGYRYSVYTWIARLALRVIEQPYNYHEINPFEPMTVAEAELLPFGRVPVLRHQGQTVYETGAITRYLARCFDRDDLLGITPQVMAQVDQVIGIIDAYGYWPMVRQVFSHGMFRPHLGLEADADVIREGLMNARPVLQKLESIAAEKRVLSGIDWSLADVHLAPVMDYFLRVPEARDLLKTYPALWAWWEDIWTADALRETVPEFGAGSAG